MKKLFLTCVFLMATFCVSAEVIELANYTRFPGYEMNPIRTDITIFNNGDVYVTNHVYREDKVTTKLFTKLSEQQLKIVAQSVEKLTPEALVDKNPEQPMCTDTPSYVWEAHSSTVGVMPIYREHSCHEYFILSWTNGPLADSIRVVLNGLVDEYYQQ